MPKKIRELNRKGKSHELDSSLYAGKLTISGKDGADAKRYQEQAVEQAIKQVKRSQGDEQI
ncbi:hypothetical protein HJG54_08835 [Leptolyngbya sp. NK1-12]|uniref:Uncharacterized protein n=1 Tax=Leptolyngbya sp. NK1-12 TaxID=2547451 RepID=A0AA96WA93_9CYAN|nr:hypothetical protein [Leptolyngbya sp. NK1-12]WNZ21383.1 hypothetical protein HJG54_08835 [Leptolyngbya sp. NK1-12]